MQSKNKQTPLSPCKKNVASLSQKIVHSLLHQHHQIRCITVEEKQNQKNSVNWKTKRYRDLERNCPYINLKFILCEFSVVFRLFIIIYFCFVTWSPQRWSPPSMAPLSHCQASDHWVWPVEIKKMIIRNLIGILMEHRATKIYLSYKKLIF